MVKRAVSVVLACVVSLWAWAAAAQSTFVQLEARPDLNSASDLVRAYAAGLENVNGFRMTSGWYGIALGPFSEEEAVATLQRLRSQGVIPPDSFLTQASAYAQQFFPEGANVLAGPEPVQGDTDTAEVPAPEPVDTETPQQAARSEAVLTREEKFELQRALQWFGFYTGAIDASFGPGTRGSMAAWQQEKGYEATGILTTFQRGVLLDEYNSVLSSIGLASITDVTAGIEMTLPLAMVDFDRYEPPFAHYTPINDSGVTVLLISQTGDAATLLGLYDIMQTLKIVPLEGERNRTANSFTLTGQDARVKSYTYAVLSGGAVKGFTLIWPAGEDRRYDVTLRAMRDSFASISGSVLPDAVGDTALEQSIDLFSGLEIRRPLRSRSGFYVDNQGRVLTNSDAIAGCGRITLDEVYDARVVAQAPEQGLAVLEPDARLAPIAFARLQSAVPRLQSEIAVAGYSYEGVLSAPTMTYGTLDALSGLEGEVDKTRLSLTTASGDIGGPVFDSSGGVVGMLLPDATPDGKRLPGDVNFATNAATIAEFLSNSGVLASAADSVTPISADDLAKLAANLTVLVSCWE